HNGAMAATGAADRDGEVALAFTDVMRNQINQQAFNAFQKFGGLRKGANVVANLGIEPGVLAQLGHEVRIRQKAHIEDEIGIAGYAVTIAETDDGDEHRALLRVLETL